MLRGSRILIADRNSQQLNTVQALLLSAGCFVTAVTNTRAARAAMAERPPELILLDMSCAALVGEQPQIPVIFLLSGADPAAIRRIYALGARDYLLCPPVPAIFLTRLETQLEQLRLEQALDRYNAELHRFCMTVSHDLKAPFTIIPTLVEMLSGELPAQERQLDPLLADISRNSTAARTLIEGLYAQTMAHHMDHVG